MSFCQSIRSLNESCISIALRRTCICNSKVGSISHTEGIQISRQGTSEVFTLTLGLSKGGNKVEMVSCQGFSLTDNVPSPRPETGRFPRICSYMRPCINLCRSIFVCTFINNWLHIYIHATLGPHPSLSPSYATSTIITPHQLISWLSTVIRGMYGELIRSMIGANGVCWCVWVMVVSLSRARLSRPPPPSPLPSSRLIPSFSPPVVPCREPSDV